MKTQIGKSSVFAALCVICVLGVVLIRRSFTNQSRHESKARAEETLHSHSNPSPAAEGHRAGASASQTSKGTAKRKRATNTSSALAAKPGLPADNVAEPSWADKDRAQYAAAQANAEVHGGGGTEKPAGRPFAAQYVENDSYPVQRTFANAGQESGVPADLLKAIAYVEGRGEHRHGEPSIDGGYGVMNLKENSQVHTLDEAAKLLRVPREDLVRDPVLNVRGAALLLQACHRDAQVLNVNEDPWVAAVKQYSGLNDDQAEVYVQQVLKVLREGAQQKTLFGDVIEIPAGRDRLLQESGGGSKQ